MNRMPYLLAALFVVSSILGACSGTPDKPDKLVPTVKQYSQADSAQELFLHANKSLNARHWAAAIKVYDLAIKADPTRWDIYMNRAIAQAANNEFEAAIHSIEESLDNGGDRHIEVYFNLGNIYQNRGLYSQSINAYRAGMAVAGKLDVECLLNIAAAYTFLAQYDSAQVTLEKVVEIAPDDPRAPHGLALLLQLQDQIDEAVAAYAQVHAIAPNFSMSYYNLGQLYFESRRFHESVQAFQRYIDLDPQGPYVDRAKQARERSQFRLDHPR